MTANDIIQLLLNNPYPLDLMRIRKLAESYETEEDAKERMVAYCTTEFLIDALHEHYTALHMAKRFMEEQEAVS